MSESTTESRSGKTATQQQRALVFQGGGALGAYEAGIYKALYEGLKSEVNEIRPLFDIVAGTSAGAINATLIVNHFLQNKEKMNPWEGSAEILYQYWQDVSTNTLQYENPFMKGWLEASSFLREGFNNFWVNALRPFDGYFGNIREQSPFLPSYYLWPDRLGSLASTEAFRRYWSWYQFSYLPWGTHNVLSPPIYQPDFRFLNPSNYMLRFDNSPIVKTIRKFWDDSKNPIKTDEGQPRLLLVGVDVQDATTITFDSYPKKHKQRMSVYGDDDSKLKHVIEYPDGIKMEHLLTTMSSHLRYKFPELLAITGEVIDDKIPEGKQNDRIFMDGYYLSNTPLREVIQSHRDYWYKVKGLKDNVPPLEVYIGDLYPTKEQGIPEDPDSINNRVQNILFHDKSKYDEKVTAMVSDYVNIINSLMDMIRSDRNYSSNDYIYRDLKKPLANKIVSISRNGDTREIRKLIEGRVTINKLQRIGYGEGQSLENSNDINGKAFDFSRKTINDLINQGSEDTKAQCDFQP
ncbi:patatin-like phospholipase family protein [Candidatus Nitrosocosmicus arcticus]|uniref:Putative Patatin-like phospholipase n=1 Tax=Candidatus Nitrosocosmicus arcticus TaxID=2035267 RepID=A0A557SUE3_9ARCH|nr:patatin-like phospholipase family protein [Candidatus Nitrosocosmicus arcticus]TVP40224.1 putative Patatin-like phospholipase [Candidatus Nitrosocosmicus arcticus]